MEENRPNLIWYHKWKIAACRANGVKTAACVFDKLTWRSRLGRLVSSCKMFWAHSDPAGLSEDDPDSRWQKLSAHLGNVAELAEFFAREAQPNDLAFHRAARAAGLLHDFGKYTQNFQLKIRGQGAGNAVHAAHGAWLAREKQAADVAFAIAGHHAGLQDKAVLKEQTSRVSEDARAILESAKADCPALEECFGPEALLAPPDTNGTDSFDVRTRMLFSCLVDADRTDTGRHYGTYFEAFPETLRPEERLRRLLTFVGQRASRVAAGAVKSARQEVLQACLKAAGEEGNLFSLTVPTGGGKTLASMAFALERARRHPERVRRIVVVIPYLSIIEQNAEVFRQALGPEAVLEHHSGDFGRDEPEDPYTHPARRQATETWNAPIVVTTSVRFFESLFSRRPGDLRRMHNLARSVVILDEVQTLPRHFLGPILRMIRTLAEEWDTSFLFCTATQPAFEKRNGAARDLRWQAGTVREIVPQPAHLFLNLKRVSVEWRSGKRSWNEIARELCECRQALCVVNTRRQARGLFSEVQGLAGHRAGVFHLSTLMCAAHRLERLAEIRDWVSRGDDCLVVSTQLVEAGVDLDFPVVFRALGPFDSIAQAAGRCDREGRLTQAAGRPAGRVIVFDPEDAGQPSGVYSEATGYTRSLAAEGLFGIDDPAMIRLYFERLYGDADLGNDLQELRDKQCFREVDRRFEMIAERTQAVIVPYDAKARELIQKLRSGSPMDSKLMRSAQRYTVGLYPQEILAGRQGAIAEVRPGTEIFFCLEGFYDGPVGIVLEPTEAAFLV